MRRYHRIMAKKEIAMKAIILLFFLSPFPALAETIFSDSPDDYDLIVDKKFMFYFEEGGKDYIKIFTCGDDIAYSQGIVVMYCEGGINETWTVYYSYEDEEDDLSSFMFAQENESLEIPFDTYLYRIEMNNGFRLGTYFKSVPGGYTAAKIAYLRNIEIKEPKRSAGQYPYGYNPAPNVISMEPSFDEIVFDAPFGIFKIENLLINKNTYDVRISENIGDPEGFKLLEATVK